MKKKLSLIYPFILLLSFSLLLSPLSEASESQSHSTGVGVTLSGWDIPNPKPGVPVGPQGTPTLDDNQMHGRLPQTSEASNSSMVLLGLGLFGLGSMLILKDNKKVGGQE